MESRLEAGTDRKTKSKLEGFVGRDYLRGMVDWIPAFAGMTEDKNRLNNLRRHYVYESNQAGEIEWLTAAIQIGSGGE